MRRYRAGPLSRELRLRECLPTGAGEDTQAEGDEQDENAQGENRESGRRVRRRPDGPAGEEPPGEKPVAAQPEAAERPAEQVRISRTKWTYLHNHVLACIKQAEDGQLEGAQRIESSTQTFMGVPQHDIIKWHIKQELEKCAPLSQTVHLAWPFQNRNPATIGQTISYTIPERVYRYE